MKVVLFCGGLGMRIRDHSQSVPKPLVTIGYRPILWHLMKYYSFYGHKDFILCLGYKGDMVKDYFLNYSECLSNDFILSSGGRNVSLLNTDIHDWRITFVDTGIHSNIGERLKAVEEHVDGEQVFLVNYSDGLTDLPLPQYIDGFVESGKIGSFLAVSPPYSTHLASLDNDLVTAIHPIANAGLWINGGFFVFRSDVFQYILNGEELVVEPFQRLIAERELIARKYTGFWGCMDTFKDKQRLEELHTSGQAPWEVWKAPGTGRDGELIVRNETWSPVTGAESA